MSSHYSNKIIFVMSLMLLIACEKEAVIEQLPEVLEEETLEEFEDYIGDYIESSIEVECPRNFIPIKALDGVTDDEFCVAKYEMKMNRLSGYAESVKDGTPWVDITFDEAVNKCRDLGSGYELINNDQWQTIAMQIADEDKNWLSGIAYSNGNSSFSANRIFLNSGNNKLAREGKLLAAGPDFDPCFGYSKAKCKTAYSIHFYQKRTHILPEGHTIWDFSGNASEWVSAGHSEMLTAEDELDHKFVSELHSYGRIAALYGNDQVCKNPSVMNHFCGFGRVFLSNEQSTMIGGLRGGSYNEDSGVFSANVKDSDLLSKKTSWRGFRCVYTH